MKGMIKYIATIMLVLMPVVVHAQSDLAYFGEYINHNSGIHLKIKKDGSFIINNTGMCRSTHVNGSYILNGDTLFLTTEYYPDWNITHDSTAYIHSHFINIDNSTRVPPDSVSLCFHDALEPPNRVYILFDSSAIMEMYQLDSCPSIQMHLGKAQHISAFYYDESRGLPIKFAGLKFRGGAAYRVASMDSCYGYLVHEMFLIKEGNLYQPMLINGEIVYRIFKRIFLY